MARSDADGDKLRRFHMPEYEQTVFVSYAWGGEREEIVNQIETSLQERGIRIVRDKRVLGYKGSIQQFMERIGQGNCVIVVISDKYLRSPNCMFELVEIAENKQFHDRIFPIVLADADIYDPVKRLGYVKYWEDKRNELASVMRTVDPANLQGIRDDMDLYDRIRDKISGLASILKDMNTLTPDLHRDSDFHELYHAIEKRMKDSLAESSARQEGHGNSTKESNAPGGTVSAKDGSIGVGNIQVGGDVSGNIVIGNNNQVNNK
jgi:internalin A